MKISVKFLNLAIAAMLMTSINSYAEEQDMSDGTMYPDDMVTKCEREAEGSENPDLYLQECIDRVLYPEASSEDNAVQ